jgi:hypothetical protein
MNIVGSNAAVTSTFLDYEQEIVQSNCDGKYSSVVTIPQDSGTLVFSV